MNKYLLLSISAIVFCFNFSIFNANAQEYKTLKEWQRAVSDYSEQFYKSQIPPSFDCDKASSWKGGRICFGNYSDMLSLQDNLFNDYYKFVIQNVDDNDKENVISIGNKVMNFEKEYNDSCYYDNEYDLDSCIANSYNTGIADLSDFLFFYQNGKYIKHYKKLFGDISLQELKRSWQYEESKPAADLLRDFAAHGLINLDGSLKIINTNFGNVKGNDLKYTTYKAWNAARLDYKSQLKNSRIPPSFDCTKLLTEDEDYICFEGLNLSSLDNLFNDYYQFVMKNIDESDKKNVIRIAKKLMKERTETIFNTGCRYGVSYVESGMDFCMSDRYKIAITDLTDFLISHQNGKYVKYYKELFGDRNVEEMKQDWEYVFGVADMLLYDFTARGLINLDGTLKVVSPRAKTADDIKKN